MDKLIAFAFVFTNIVNIATGAVVPTSDYCWRDFKGVIPKDAFSVGVDDRGKSIYVGQILVEDKIIPGKVHEDDDHVYYEWEEQAWSAKENVKILCTKHPENFVWLSTTSYQVPKLTNEQLIKGGFQVQFYTYIGRVSHGTDGKSHVGKVICPTSGTCLALYINDSGNNKEYSTFEILTYNPDSANSRKQNH